MTSSADLAYRLKHNPIPIDGSGPLGGWEDVYITPGHTHECHPDFIATPIGDSPYGFLVCQRKKNSEGLPMGTPMPRHGTGRIVRHSQSYNLYDDTPNALPGITRLGGQPRSLPDRRPPHQAHLQGNDYYRDPIRYRGIGIEKIDAVQGEFGYQENKYYHSTPPPQYDVTHAVQPFELWKREQLRMGNISPEEMTELEKNHTFVNKDATF